MPDLLALWGSPAWTQEVDDWVARSVRAAGSELLGPGVPVKTRFWSVVRRYPTDAGPVWFKECNPGQAFEGPLLATLAALEPTRFPEPLALDVPAGRMLLPDAGVTVPRGGPNVPDDALRDLLVEHAGVQRRLSRYRRELMAAGLPSLTAGEVDGWFGRTVDTLASLPSSHPQHVGVVEANRLVARRRVVRDWCAVLEAGPLASTFQHDDLNPGNVARAGGRPVWFDVGDSFWSHPFAVLQVPLAMATASFPWGPAPGDARVAPLVEAYLETWTCPEVRLAVLRPLVEPALRLAQVHRCESWRRLLEHVPPDRLGTATPLLRDHLHAVSR